MNKLQRIQQFAQDNDYLIEVDSEFVYLETRKTKKVYNWESFEVKPVATYQFYLEAKGGEVASPDVYGLTSKSYKTDRGFINAIDRLQASINEKAQ